MGHKLLTFMKDEIPMSQGFKEPRVVEWVREGFLGNHKSKEYPAAVVEQIVHRYPYMNILEIDEVSIEWAGGIFFWWSTTHGS